MIYPHWFPKWRYVEIVKQMRTHRETCANCQGFYLCDTMEHLSRRLRHWKKVGKIAS